MQKKSVATTPRIVSASADTTATVLPHKQIDRLYTAKELSELGYGSVDLLAKNRMRGIGPPFIYVGKNDSVRYRESDVAAWVEANIKTHALQLPNNHKRGRPKRLSKPRKQVAS